MSLDGFFQRAANVQGHNAPMGFVGQVLSRGLAYRSLTLFNKAPQAVQVTTMAVSTYTDAATYTFTITVGGQTVTIEYVATTADADTTGVAEALVALVNATGDLRGFLSASNSTNTITFTGTSPSISFVVAESDAKLGTPSTTTTAATANPVAFARAMVDQGHVSEGNARAGHVPTQASFTKQVISFTFATAASAFFSGTFTINGKTIQWGPVDHNTDLDTTCGDIATAMETALNAAGAGYTAIAASVGSAGGVVTVTADVAGAEFEASAWASGAAAAAAAKAYTTGPSVATSLRRALGGLSERSTEVENQTRGGDDPAYPANHGVRVMAAGHMVVSTSGDSPSFGGEVWVDLTDSSSARGTLRTAGAANRVWLPPEIMRWDRDEPSDQSNNVGLVAVNTGRVF